MKYRAKLAFRVIEIGCPIYSESKFRSAHGGADASTKSAKATMNNSANKANDLITCAFLLLTRVRGFVP